MLREEVQVAPTEHVVEGWVARDGQKAPVVDAVLDAFVAFVFGLGDGWPGRLGPVGVEAGGPDGVEGQDGGAAVVGGLTLECGASV